MPRPPYGRHGEGPVKSCAYVCSRNSLAALNAVYIVSIVVSSIVLKVSNTLAFTMTVDAPDNLNT